MAEAVRHPELTVWPREVQRLQLELAGIEAALEVHNPCDQATLAGLRQRQRELCARIEAAKSAVMTREGLA
jgi:hypothetical protein